MGCFRGSDIGSKIITDITKVRKYGQSVSSYGDGLLKLKVGLEIRNTNDPNFKTFSRYVQKDKRVFLIRFCEKGGVGHVVFVESRYRVIYDSEEQYTLSLT